MISQFTVNKTSNSSSRKYSLPPTALDGGLIEVRTNYRTLSYRLRRPKGGRCRPLKKGLVCHSSLQNLHLGSLNTGRLIEVQLLPNWALSCTAPLSEIVNFSLAVLLCPLV